MAKKNEQAKLNLAAALPDLESWEDVDKEILVVAQLELEIDGKENDLNTRVTAIQAELGPSIKALKTERERREARVLAFAKKHRADFGDKKSRKFNFGTIAFSKAATAVKFLLDELVVIANLKKHGFAAGVVKTKEWIDKNAIEGAVPDAKRAAVGFEVVPTGDQAQLKIDKKAIEIMRASAKKAS